MTVILVLALFVSFLVVERFTNKPAPEYILQTATAPRAEASARKPVPVVAGFEIPEHMRYHPGHAWALSESPNLVRVGMDDFAAKLLARSRTSACRSAASGSARDRRCSFSAMA